MSSVIIKKADKDDMPQVLQLIKELALYEKSPESVTLTLNELVESGEGAIPIYYCHVAINETQIIGFCIYYIGFSTWKGKMVYLDDLFVLEPHRKSGIGHLLFEEVRNFAKLQNANLMRWMVLDWNQSAIEFYKKKKASFDAEWIQCQLDKSQL